ncbi:MAG: PH domain-containing protein [Actinomycetota bacterium]
MPFPKQLLTDDEDLVLDLRPHWWFLAPAASVLVVLTLLGLAALLTDWWAPIDWVLLILWVGAVGWFAWMYMQWTTTNFVVTSERVVSRTGVISKAGIEIPLDRINTVFFNQSIFERIIGAGDLGIESAGEGGRQEFSNIRRPNIVQNEIYRQVEGLEDRRLQRLGEAASGGRSAEPAPLSIPEQIEKLDQLRRQGVVTDEEFEAKKKELLDRM